MRIIISNTSGEPIYEQISTQIKNLIFTGELSEGDALPSIRSLAQELKISVITTKRAYEELEGDGFIETIPSKGSYVSRKNKELMKEKHLKLIEDKLIEVLEEANLLNLSLDDLKDMLQILYDSNK
ncbi:GntR family transcriptional regulator [Clostridium manihotivorum]|uniref:GntR family transcriptional regulator n=1 Tax=Clostridium manihotivorum TaxID=2320868 RepID=A0A3R5X4Y5_9CLOT|nr:GntR family transcriptional regulator [Clostridium manihotivorum]QAA34843.1 GntR family transcriptional regulator [Clostridium manihotivorum]